jgi:glycosyltransferase involved in cell wall biosynthesis
MNEKLVSIIMPVYNAERFLHQAIQSILDQTYKNFELIIIDDGSTDSSSIIIKSFSDERIRSFFFENQGVSKTRNIGISVSRGEFIALMDADDISEQTRIEKQLEYLFTNKEIDVVGTNCVSIKTNGKLLSYHSYPEFHKEIEFVAPILGPICFATMMTSKNNLIKIGCYNETLLVSGDHDLLLRLISNGNKIYNYQEYLYKRRICNSSLSFLMSEKQNHNHYIASLRFLKDSLKTESRKFYNYRRGLLEYYYGNVSISRIYLFRSLRQNFAQNFKVIRMIVISLLGNKAINFLRDKGALKFINRIIFKLFKVNLQKI